MSLGAIGTDANFALVGPDFVMIAADKCQLGGAVIMSNQVEKMHLITPNLLMSCIGVPSHVHRFCEYVTTRYKLFEFQNCYPLSTASTVNFACRFLADNLRTPNALRVQTLIASCEEEEGPQLYLLDNFGTMAKMEQTGCHGYGGILALSILDKNWTPDLTQEKAYDIIKCCVWAIQKRFMINMPNYSVKVVDRDGVKTLSDITAEAIALELYDAEDLDITL